MSKLYSTTKLINLKYGSGSTTGTGITTGNVNIHFPIKEIIVKQIICNTTDTVTSKILSYGFLTSDMVGNQCLGSVYINSTVGGSTSQNIRFCYANPVYINGTFNFSLLDGAGALYSMATNTQYNISVILEFVEAHDQSLKVVDI
jgi:hypothetical protein